ncbi:MAG: SurA N-terminal domain-containing protein, partial [Nitrospiraceae bacterium]|nr:SurA N-terminal domain-containing protein [Nitrospiraceae bacterium]
MTGRRRWIPVALLALLVFAAGCAKPVAMVNGRPIDRKTFEEAMKESSKSSAEGEDTADRQKAEGAVLNELITRMLMLDEAGKRGITVTDDEVNREIEGIRKSMGDAAFAETLKEKGITTDGFRKQTREKMLMSRFTEGLLGNESVADEAVRRYYSESPRPFFRPVKVLMNMIEFDSEEAAAAAMREIREKKVDFDDLALRAGNENRAHASGYGWANPDL